MNAKEFLGQSFYINGLIDANLEELSRLRALSTSVQGQDLSRERVKSSGRGDRTGDIVTRIIEQEEIVNADIDRLIDVKEEIRCVIGGIEDERFRTVLQMRYLGLKRWEDISEAMGYNLYHIYKLHRKAIADLEKRPLHATNNCDIV